jgi:pimeloyl-ACP methyl ester carboxylesterase
VGPPERLSPAHIRAFLAGVRCPALLLRPSRGWPLSPEQAAEARELLRGVQIVAIEGGHHVHLERPEDVGRCIAPFLAGEGDSRT